MKLKITLMLLALASLPLCADEYSLPDVPEERIGTYIPVQWDLQFRRTKLFYAALAAGNPDGHDVLFIGKNECYSDEEFHDGYAIPAADFADFRFVENDGGRFVLDKAGNSYRQISRTLDGHGYGYAEYTRYVIGILFDFARDMKNVSVDGEKITINGRQYTVNLDGTFFSTKNVALWLFSEEHDACALMKDGLNARLVASRQGEYRMLYPKEDELIAEIPLFFVDKSDYERTPTDRLSRQQLRYLRNYVYARHGYAFKDKELRAYFENFTWYTADPDFSEERLTELQKNFVRGIQRQEASAR